MYSKRTFITNLSQKSIGKAIFLLTEQTRERRGRREQQMQHCSKIQRTITAKTSVPLEMWAPKTNAEPFRHAVN